MFAINSWRLMRLLTHFVNGGSINHFTLSNSYQRNRMLTCIMVYHIYVRWKKFKPLILFKNQTLPLTLNNRFDAKIKHSTGQECQKY